MDTVNDLYGKLVSLILEGCGEFHICARDPMSGNLWNLDEFDFEDGDDGKTIVIIT
jgi:hypothetical protein